MRHSYQKDYVMNRDDVLQTVKATVEDRDAIRKIRCWAKILGGLYQEDLLDDDPFDDYIKTIRGLMNRRISVFSVVKMFHEFGLSPALKQPRGIGLEILLRLHDEDLYENGEIYESIYAELYCEIGNVMSLFSAVGCEMYVIPFPDLSDPGRANLPVDEVDALRGYAKDIIKREVAPFLQDGLKSPREWERLFDMSDDLVENMGHSLVVERLPVYRELEEINVPEKERWFRDRLVSRKGSVLLEPCLCECFDGVPPVVVSSLNYYYPDFENYLARDLSRFDVITLGFRFLTLMYLEYAKKWF